MSRGSLGFVLVLLLAPVAAAEAVEDVAPEIAAAVAAAEGLAASGVSEAASLLASDDRPAEDASPREEASSEEPEDAEEARARRSQETPPEHVNHLLAPAWDTAPLVLAPVREAVRTVPVAGGLADAFLGGATGGSTGVAAPAAAPASAAAAVPTSAPLPGGAEVAGAVLLAAGAMGAAGAAAGFGSAAAEKLRRVARFLAIPLFTRLARAALLDHAVRDRIYAAVAARPGATLQDLADEGGVGRTAAAYHLRVLSREGLVASRRDGRVRRFHLNGHPLEAPERLAALGHPTGRALAEIVLAAPGLDQSALAERVAVGASLAHWHLKRLEAAGIVRKERDGRHVRYFPA